MGNWPKDWPEKYRPTPRLPKGGYGVDGSDARFGLIKFFVFLGILYFFDFGSHPFIFSLVLFVGVLYILKAMVDKYGS